MNAGQAGVMENGEELCLLFKGIGGFSDLLRTQALLAQLFECYGSAAQVGIGRLVDGAHATGTDQTENAVPSMEHSIGCQGPGAGGIAGDSRGAGRDRVRRGKEHGSNRQGVSAMCTIGGMGIVGDATGTAQDGQVGHAAYSPHPLAQSAGVSTASIACTSRQKREVLQAHHGHGTTRDLLIARWECLVHEVEAWESATPRGRSRMSGGILAVRPVRYYW